MHAESEAEKLPFPDSPSSWFHTWFHSRRYELAVWGVLLLSFGLRFYALGDRVFDTDEIAEVLRIRGWGLLWWSGPEGFTPRPFLLNIIAKMVASLGGGEHELTLRFVPLFFAIAAVALVYYIGRRVANPKVGLVASFIIAVNPYLSWYAQYLRPYTMLLFFSALATALLIRQLTDRPRFSIGAAYGASLLLTIACQWQGALVVVFHEVFYVGLRLKRRASLRRWAIIHAVLLMAAILLFPLVARVGQFILNWPGYDGDVPAHWDAWVQILSDCTVGKHMAENVRGVVLPLVIVLLEVGLLALWRLNRATADYLTRGEQLLLFMAWVVVPLGLASVHPHASALLGSSRFFIFVLPALCFVLAQGLLALRRLSFLLMVQAILLVLFVSMYSYKDCYGKNVCGRFDRSNYSEIARNIEANEWPGDCIVAMYDFTATALRYYYHGPSSVITLQPKASDPPEGAPWQMRAQSAFEQSRRVWWLPVLSPEDQAWVLKEAEAALDSYGYRLEEVVFEPKSTSVPPAIAWLFVSRLDPNWRTEAVGAHFGPGILLEGYAIDAGPISSGDGFRLRLTWRTLRHLGEDYKTTVRLFDEQHSFVTQKDNVPANWTRPTSSWQVGERVEDVYVVQLPRSARTGRYTIELGLYQQDTLEMLPVSGSDAAAAKGLLSLSSIDVVVKGN